ncbi:hypothetical protein CGCA056_v010823 [Colletotrichum aenigma]|uniref:uncharacterized protein n=1 Tax=Colletotrichum aenigma TaxID=1215731 RepID=UPI001872CC8E|nr:uncharacterized protein CGCA056_v010823 [Colletotrichum aenigma]KAF5517820.1 hypothetical protein CGCA056_v010823 [Colletotrichum aenigma]
MAPSGSDQLSKPFTKDERKILRRELRHLVKKNATTRKKLEKGIEDMKSFHPDEQQLQQESLADISRRMRKKVEKFRFRQKGVLANREQLYRSDPSSARARDIDFMKDMLANLDEGIASAKSSKRKSPEESNEKSGLEWDSDSTSDSDNMVDDADNHSAVERDLGTPTKKEGETAAKSTDADDKTNSGVKDQNDEDKKQKKRKKSKSFSAEDAELPQAQDSADIVRKAKKHKRSKSLSVQEFGTLRDSNISPGDDLTNAASDKKKVKKSKSLLVDKISKETKNTQEQLEPTSPQGTFDEKKVSTTVLETANAAEKGDEDGALNDSEIVEFPTSSNIAALNDKKQKRKRKNKKRSHPVDNDGGTPAPGIEDTAVVSGQITAAPPKQTPKGPTRIDPPAAPAIFSDLLPRYNPFLGFQKTYSTQKAEPIFTPPEKPSAKPSSSSAVESGQTWVLDTVGSRKKSNSVTMKIGKVETPHQTDQESPTPPSTREKKKRGKPKKAKGPATTAAKPSASVSSVHASGDLVQSLHPGSHGKLAQLAAATGPAQRSQELQKKLAEDRKMIAKERDAWKKIMKF